MSVRHDKDTGAWTQRGASAGEWCAAIMDSAVASMRRLFVTRMKLRMFALCVGICLEQKITGAQWEDTNW